jgi:hypothetical protein
MYNAHILEMEDTDWPDIIKVIETTIAEIKDARKAYDESEKARLEGIAEAKRLAEEKRLNDQRIYNFRCEDLVGLGMRLGQTGYGYVNKYGQHTSITFDEIRGKENWKECIATITEAISILKQKEIDETNRLDAIEASRKPQIQRTREYLAAVLNVPGPDINDVKLKDILLTFKEKLTTAVGSANRSLLEYEK